MHKDVIQLFEPRLRSARDAAVQSVARYKSLLALEHLDAATASTLKRQWEEIEQDAHRPSKQQQFWTHQIEIVEAIPPPLHVMVNGRKEPVLVDSLHLLQPELKDLANANAAVIVESPVGQVVEHHLR